MDVVFSTFFFWFESLLSHLEFLLKLASSVGGKSMFGTNIRDLSTFRNIPEFRTQFCNSSFWEETSNVISITLSPVSQREIIGSSVRFPDLESKLLILNIPPTCLEVGDNGLTRSAYLAKREGLSIYNFPLVFPPHSWLKKVQILRKRLGNSEIIFKWANESITVNENKRRCLCLQIGEKF